MKLPLPVALGLGLILALILRVPDLDQRPFHNDEAVNAIKFRELDEQGTYYYDPTEYHGPLLQYATLCLVRCTGWTGFEASTEASFRWLSVLAGLSLFPLLWFTRDALGRSGTIAAATFTAVSPSLTFFSRDYIHETLLVSAAFLLIGCAWRYSRKPHWKWAVAGGLAVAAMHTTKETFVINLGAMVLAFGLLLLWTSCEAGTPRLGLPGKPWHWGLGVCVWLAVAALFFSSFGSNPSGPLDALRTYLPWFNRAGGESPHTQPFWFFGQRLFWQPSGSALPWSELGMLLFAVIGAGAAVLRRGLGAASVGFVRWLALYTGLMFAVYSLIPYKTPWCILSVSHGLALLAGVGLAVVWQRVWQLRLRVVLALVTLVVLGQLSWQAWALSHAQASSRHNPWAYADTVPDLRNLLALLDELAAVAPEGRALHLQVICQEGDYWPLPYYLRGFSQVGWWSQVPPTPLAPVVVVSPRMLPESDFTDSHISAGFFQVRHGVFRQCLVEQGLWETFLKTRSSN